MNKTVHMLKAVASAVVPGLGQVFNKQFWKALVFFFIVTLFVGIELGSSRYFADYDSYVKVVSDANSGVGELYPDSFARGFYTLYQYEITVGDTDAFDLFDAFYAVESIDEDGFTMRDLIDFTATDILAHSTPRYYPLIDDLVVTVGAARTSNTGIIDEATDFIIGEDDDAIAAKDFYRVLSGFTVYNVGGQEYYTIGSEETADVYTNLNDPSDVLTAIPEGADVYYRTGEIFLDAVADKVYVKSTKSISVTSTAIYRYVNVADSTDFLDPEDAVVDTLKELTVKGNIVVDETETLYVQFIPEINYRKDAGYNPTAFSSYLRDYITERYNLSTSSMTSKEYNRFLLEVYFSVHPELRTEFETNYYNWFHDTAGFFVKGFWSVLTLGQSDKREYYYNSLHDALKSVRVTDGASVYVPVSGILDYTPLIGHTSQFLLISGLISSLLFAYFLLVYVWGIIDAYSTSKKFSETGERITDRAWFVNVFNHGFEYIMILPALFVITFISIMPIIFGFLIAFTNFSGFDTDTGRFVWVGFSNFARIFTFGEGIPFAETFWKVLFWTVIWAIFSTVTVFFGGMFQAVVISSERVPFKKFWRTLLILPWAVPALISQMAFSIIFSERGVINALLRSAGVYDTLTRWGMLGTAWSESALSAWQKFIWLGQDNIQWFNNAHNVWFVRIVLIVVNIWLGAPYFMALMTSIMTSIDRTLYEAADIDGATPSQKFKFITFPLIMYSTSPILVMTFSGNFNNFGVIYFITQGGSGAGDIDRAYAGSTDILISWMYTLTVTKRVYNMASVFSILIFLMVGSIAAWNFSQTRAFKED